MFTHGASYGKCRPAGLVRRGGVESRARVIAGDFSFIGCLMEQRAIVVDITRDEDVRLTDLQCLRVELRYASRIERHTGVFQVDPGNIGRTPGRRNNVQCIVFL